MANYFFAPTSYHAGSLARQRSDATRAVLERAGISEATVVLDIGCGAGQTPRLVEDLNPAAMLIGVDPDPEVCRDGSAAAERIHFIQAEGEHLPLADGSVDFAICRVAINYMHHAKAVREFARVLAPGATLVLS